MGGQRAGPGRRRIRASKPAHNRAGAAWASRLRPGPAQTGTSLSAGQDTATTRARISPSPTRPTVSAPLAPHPRAAPWRRVARKPLHNGPGPTRLAHGTARQPHRPTPENGNRSPTVRRSTGKSPVPDIPAAIAPTRPHPRNSPSTEPSQALRAPPAQAKKSGTAARARPPWVIHRPARAPHPSPVPPSSAHRHASLLCHAAPIPYPPQPAPAAPPRPSRPAPPRPSSPSPAAAAPSRRLHPPASCSFSLHPTISHPRSPTPSEHL